MINMYTLTYVDRKKREKKEKRKFSFKSRWERDLSTPIYQLIVWTGSVKQAAIKQGN